MMSRRRWFAAAALPLLALTLTTGCKKKDDAVADAGPPADAAPAVVDAGAAAMPTPSNEAQVAHFGDETKLDDVQATIAAAHTTARSAAPGGAVVATLTHGTAVTEIASHGGFILVQFLDPKDATKALEGWVGDSAFKAAGVLPTPPKGTCPAKQVHLISDDTIFCGDICKVDGDCPNSEKCTGHANSYADGKEGPAVTTCTTPPGTPTATVDAGTTPTPAAPKGPTIKDVQMSTDATGKCSAPGYVLATDGQCHKTCPKGPADCPNAQSKCTAKITADKTGVCQSTAK